VTRELIIFLTDVEAIWSAFLLPLGVYLNNTLDHGD